MSKRVYNSWKQEDMEEALSKLRSNTIGFNEAHRIYNIPKPTLRRHLRELNTHTSFGRPRNCSIRSRKMNVNSTPPDLQLLAEDEDTNMSLPFKSKERYEQKYCAYCTWRSEKGAKETTEDVLSAYLTERSKIVNPGSLWCEYSMIKTMIKLREKVDVSEMSKVQVFMHQNSKNYTPQKSSTLTDKECMQFLKEAPDEMYLMMKAALIIGIYGACRKCEMTDFEVEHLTFCDDYLVVTIPKTKNSTPRTFVVPKIIDGIQMAELVKRYIALRPAHTPHKRLFVFYAKGKCSTNPVGRIIFGKIPARIAEYLKLPEAHLYTGLCYKRTSATFLANAGGWKFSAATNQVKLEETDEEMEYEAQLPGSSTSLPSFQDIVLSPITIEPKEEDDLYYAENDERISLILNKKLSFLPEQLPLRITDGEYKVMTEIISNNNVFRNVTLLTKVHCTMCDAHLGAAPIAQFDRFVHPVLNTLVCKSCFVAYNTAEFSKDEDGSEMYCKWCAQSGTVICCSGCPLVFCKVCVERNFGERGWEKIAFANTWQCFKCNPSQLSKLHIMCSAVHEYTLKIIEKAIKTGDKDILEKDISICCKEDSTTTNKRKHIVLDNEVLDIPIALSKSMKVNPDNTNFSLDITRKLSPIISPPATNESSTKTDVRTFNCVLLEIALDQSEKVVDSFTRQCEDVRQAIRTPKENAQYAKLQYSMQDALIQCSRKLHETRAFLIGSNTNNKKVPARLLPAASKTAVTSVDGAAGKNSTIITPSPSGLHVLNLTRPVLLKPPGFQPPILLKPKLTPIRVRTTQNAINKHSAITATGSKPALMSQIQPTNSVRLVNSNVKKNSLATVQVGSKTVGIVVPTSMVAAGKNNLYDNRVLDAKKTKTVDMDPLAMSDDESEGSFVKTEIDIIDEPIMVKVEEDAT